MASKPKRKADFPPDKPLAQCEKCKRIKIRSFYRKKDFIIESIALMPKLKKIVCYACSQKERS